MEKPLFSIILLHYNQPNYVKGALDSIFMQTYDNIELIFADDASFDIDLKTIKQYINENKKENIRKVDWQINHENAGTVKTLNSAIQKCSGEYLLFFAADDQLYDDNVIENFYCGFQKTDHDVYMISSQCHMMDIELKVKQYDFVKPAFANCFNHFTSKEQFCAFTKDCFLAIGATAMKMKMFEKYGYFDERYQYIEDLSWFLSLTRSGGKIYYCNFNGLLHRDGGISKYTDNALMLPHVLGYKLDMVHIFENEIIPFISDFDINDIQRTIAWYEGEKNGYINAGGNVDCIKKSMIRKHLPAFYIKNIIWGIDRNFPHHIKKAFDNVLKLNILLISTALLYIIFKMTVIQLCLFFILSVIFFLFLKIFFLFSFKVLYRLRNHLKNKRGPK